MVQWTVVDEIVVVVIVVTCDIMVYVPPSYCQYTFISTEIRTSLCMSFVV